MSEPLVAKRISLVGCECGSVHFQLHDEDNDVIATAVLDASILLRFAASFSAASMTAFNHRRAAEMGGTPGCTRH